MKKILVTGATGFIGYHVAKKLINREAGEVFCLCRESSELKYLKTLKVQLLQGDLRNQDSLMQAMKGKDVLFHIAADYRLWSKNPQELIDSNVQGTENILAVAQKNDVQKIIYTSSVSAVGRPLVHYRPPGEMNRIEWEKQFSGDESMDPFSEQLIGPYKKSKYLAERVARRFALQGSPIVIVNPSTPIGAYDSKPTPTGKMILDFLNRKMPAYLDTGLNFIDVEDVAEGHLLAAEKGQIGERYILGHKNLMLKEVLDMLSHITKFSAPQFKVPYWIAYTAGKISTSIAQITGFPPSIPFDGVKMAKEIMFYQNHKAVEKLGLPQNSVESALEKAVQFFRQNQYVQKT